VSQQLEHLRILRRQILRALEAAGRAVLGADDLLDGLTVIGEDGRREARAELAKLQTWGFVENLGNADEPAYRLTESGLSQITREARPLDSRIHGNTALSG